MDLGYLPPLPVGLMSAATRQLAFGAARCVAAIWRLLPLGPGVVVLASVLFVWLLGFVDWDSGSSRVLAGISGASLVATVALAVGWAADPDRLERWALWAAVSAIVAVLPLVIG